MGVFSFTYQKTPKSIGGFEIDAFISEHYSFNNSVTDIPVEEGSNVADNVVEESDTIQISAFIGKTAFEVWEGDIPQSPEDIPAEDPKSRIRAAYQELLRLKREKQPVDVVMGLDTFSNMVITSFDIDREVETGADLPFEMSFKRILIVKSETTTVNAAGPSGDQVAGTSSVGTAGTSKVDPNSNRAQMEWKQLGENSGWTYPTREEYLEKCKQAGWVP
jgi:hypothetical protein